MAQPDRAVPTPERREPQLGGNQLGHSDRFQGARDRNDNDTADLADELCTAAEMVVAGAVLSAPDADVARRLLALAPVDAFRDPVPRFVIRVAAELVTEAVIPHPLEVITWAVRNNVRIPVRETPISELSRIAANAPVSGNPVWAATQVRENHYRRRIDVAGRQVSAAAWSDAADVRELVARGIAELRAAVDAIAPAETAVSAE